MKVRGGGEMLGAGSEMVQMDPLQAIYHKCARNLIIPPLLYSLSRLLPARHWKESKHSTSAHSLLRIPWGVPGVPHPCLEGCGPPTWVMFQPLQASAKCAHNYVAGRGENSRQREEEEAHSLSIGRSRGELKGPPKKSLCTLQLETKGYVEAQEAVTCFIGDMITVDCQPLPWRT